MCKRKGDDIVPLLSLTFLFGITTFVADELLEETLGLEAAPVEVMVTSRVLVVISVSDYTINAHVSTFSMLQTNVDECQLLFNKKCVLPDGRLCRNCECLNN